MSYSRKERGRRERERDRAQYAESSLLALKAA